MFGHSGTSRELMICAESLALCAPSSLCAVLCAADFMLMHDGKSADADEGNFVQLESFEFDSVADGGAPIKYNKTLLAGDDGKGFYFDCGEPRTFVCFAAAEIETWQL